MLSGLWEDEGIGKFRPERWLKVVKDDDSGEDKEVFDPLAGPTLAFGLGPRGCFGKMLASVSLRMQFALIVWHFELNGTPEGLSSFNAVQKFAREPEMCFVRLGLVGGGCYEAGSEDLSWSEVTRRQVKELVQQKSKNGMNKDAPPPTNIGYLLPISSIVTSPLLPEQVNESVGCMV